MTLPVFFGCAFVAFGPALALFLLTVVGEPLRVIILIAGAFFWLVSLLLSSLVWFVAAKASDPADQALQRGLLVFGVLFSVALQEAFRFLYYKLLRKAMEGLLALSEDGCSPISIQQMAYGTFPEGQLRGTWGKAAFVDSGTPRVGGVGIPGVLGRELEEGEPLLVRATLLGPEGSPVPGPEWTGWGRGEWPKALLDDGGDRLALLGPAQASAFCAHSGRPGVRAHERRLRHDQPAGGFPGAWHRGHPGRLPTLLPDFSLHDSGADPPAYLLGHRLLPRL
uniref:Gamma-secretase subunit APH-1 n=1 Tax=Pseudonaja textilis TaxID=8673 RepID=A0A670Z0F9_PSETE